MCRILNSGVGISGDFSKWQIAIVQHLKGYRGFLLQITCTDKKVISKIAFLITFKYIVIMQCVKVVVYICFGLSAPGMYFFIMMKKYTQQPFLST